MFPKIWENPQIIHLFIGFSLVNHPFWDIPIFENTHMHLPPPARRGTINHHFSFKIQVAAPRHCCAFLLPGKPPTKIPPIGSLHSMISSLSSHLFLGGGFLAIPWVVPPPRIPVTTRIITFLVGDPYKPSFATVSGRGDNPSYTILLPLVMENH